MGSFSDRVALVTGASSGIGRAIALALAREGASLCLVGRRRDALESVAAAVSETASPALIYCADLASDDSVLDLQAAVARDLGRLHILIHGAGVFARGRHEDADVADLDRQYRANVRGPYLLTQRLIPLLRGGSGDIVFLNSTAGVSAAAHVGQYAASKHAVKAIADSLREELNADQVRVLSVFIGRTATPMQQAVHAAEGKPYRPERLMQPEDIAAMVLAGLALPRTAEVTEIRMRPLRKDA